MAENGTDSLPFEPTEQENIRLREENARLRRLLSTHGIAITQWTPTSSSSTKATESMKVNREERARKRIALFRSLFRGREDVYAYWWERAEGQSGYSPAAIKNWKTNQREPPRRTKKVDQKTRKYLPVTGEAVGIRACGRGAPAVSHLGSEDGVPHFAHRCSAGPSWHGSSSLDCERGTMPENVCVAGAQHRPTGKASFIQKNSWLHAHPHHYLGAPVEETDGYKIGMQYGHLLLVVAHWPGKVRYLLSAGLQVPVWPAEQFYPAYYPGVDIAPDMDSRVALQHFSTTLAVIHDPPSERLVAIPRLYARRR